MDRDQRRAACRVDGYRGTLQPQSITDPARGRGVRRPDRHIGLDLGVGQFVGGHAQVVVGGQPDEHTSVAVRQGRWRDTRVLHRTPGRFQQDPVLRVHQPDLAGRHAEERGVESGHVVDEPGAAGHDLTGGTGFRIEELVHVPAVARHLRYCIAAVPQHIPELVGIGSPREARCVPDDCETRCRISLIFDGCHALVLPWPVKIDPQGGRLRSGNQSQRPAPQLQRSHRTAATNAAAAPTSRADRSIARTARRIRQRV